MCRAASLAGYLTTVVKDWQLKLSAGRHLTGTKPLKTMHCRMLWGVFQFGRARSVSGASRPGYS